MGARRWGRGAAILAALLLVMPTSSTVLGQALGPAGPSPAQDGAAVIAQGVVSLPEDDFLWRVSQQTAEPGAEPVAVAGPSFVLADGSPLLVTDVGTDDQTRLANGEAMLLRDGSEVSIESFGPTEDFFVIELLSAADTGGDPAGTVIYSRLFASPAGDRDIDLVRTVVEAGEISAPLAGAAPTLLLVTDGELVIDTELEPAGLNAPVVVTRLGTGTSAAYTGEFTAEAQVSPTIFVAAVIGPDITAAEA